MVGVCRTVAAASGGGTVQQTRACGSDTAGAAREASGDATAEDAARAQGESAAARTRQQAASSGRRTDGGKRQRAVVVGDGGATRSGGARDPQQQRCEAREASVRPPSGAVARHGAQPEATEQAAPHKGQQQDGRGDGDGNRVESRGGAHAGAGAALRGAAAEHAVRTSPAQQRLNLKRATSSEGRTGGTARESAIVVGDDDVTREGGEDSPTQQRCAVSAGDTSARSAAVCQAASSRMHSSGQQCRPHSTVSASELSAAVAAAHRESATAARV
eukprot:7375884-Prymnesium_polylepis.1